MDPPAISLHLWQGDGGGLVSHLSFVGHRPVHTIHDGERWVRDTPLPAGKATVKLDFAYDGKPKFGGGGTATLSLNGKQVGSGRIERTQFAFWSADETANVGIDRETPVSPDYTEETSRFTGKIGKVTITLK